MAARLTLDQLIEVRILRGQWFDAAPTFRRGLAHHTPRRTILSDRAIARESKDNLIMWHVYILECENGSFYTGITDNLQRRFKEHKSGKGGKFTRAFKVNKMLYSEQLATKQDALKREAQIKSWTKIKKSALIIGKITTGID